jgi:hypothetical protein
MATPAEPGKPITTDNRITLAEIKALQASNRAVVISPRKGVVIVDGFKRYHLDGTPMMTKRQLKEAIRGSKKEKEKEKAEGCDVRLAADVRPVVKNEPDYLADSIAAQFSASRLDAIRAFYKHRPRGDAWFLVSIVDDLLATLKTVALSPNPICTGEHEFCDCIGERVRSVIARTEAK